MERWPTTNPQKAAVAELTVAAQHVFLPPLSLYIKMRYVCLD
jgi:hypothetical protein